MVRESHEQRKAEGRHRGGKRWGEIRDESVGSREGQSGMGKNGGERRSVEVTRQGDGQTHTETGRVKGALGGHVTERESF